MTDEIKHPPSTLIGEAASLFYLLGGMAAKHLVIVADPLQSSSKGAAPSSDSWILSAVCCWHRAAHAGDRRLAYEECRVRRRPGFREWRGGLEIRCVCGRFAWGFPVRPTHDETRSSSRR